MKDKIEEIKKIGKKHLEGNDINFFNRVWSSDFSIYQNRLKSISFSDHNIVLDAGCGVGQWSLVLSNLNKNVVSIDVCDKRINTLKEISKSLNITNITSSVESIDNLSFSDNSFDAIFCYSAIYFTDIKKTLKEFYRVLRKGGKLYFSTNGLGWYLHNLIDGHNSSSDFDSKQMAIDTLKNSIEYYSSGIKKPGQIVTPTQVIDRLLKEIGFKNIRCGADGTLKDLDLETISFYPESYYNNEGVYEILTTK